MGVTALRWKVGAFSSGKPSNGGAVTPIPAPPPSRGTGSRSACAALLSLALTGCVSLLPKQPPVQLYVFGRSAVAPTQPAPQAMVGRGGLPGIALAQIGFPRSALGDGLLTTRGETAAYIDGARWLGPAVVLFQEAVERRFDARARTVRLVDRGQIGAASTVLRLDVQAFDARYDPANSGPPTVVVDLRATLSRADGRALVQRRFTATRPAAEDGVSAIVAAYDAAVSAVLDRTVDWTEATAPGLAAPEPPPSATPAP